MRSESSNNSNEKNNPTSLNIEQGNVICKDGFCSLPNRNKTTRIVEDDKSLFDPI